MSVKVTSHQLHCTPNYLASPSPGVDGGLAGPARSLLHQSVPHTGVDGRSARLAGTEQLQQHFSHHTVPAANLPVSYPSPTLGTITSYNSYCYYISRIPCAIRALCGERAESLCNHQPFCRSSGNRYICSPASCIHSHHCHRPQALPSPPPPPNNATQMPLLQLAAITPFAESKTTITCVSGSSFDGSDTS